MPLPDGTSTATEVSEQLNRLLVAFKPNHKPGDPLWDVMCAEYADALKRFPPMSIRAGITKMIASRKDKFWPQPAEIIDAILAAQATPKVGETAAPQGGKFLENLRKRDQQRRDDCHGIIQEFEQDQRGLYQTARAEGWELLLALAVADAADMIAKRNEARRLGHTPSNPPVTAHGVMLENVRSNGDQDWIVIRQEDIAHWRRNLGISSQVAA